MTEAKDTVISDNVLFIMKRETAERLTSIKPEELIEQMAYDAKIREEGHKAGLKEVAYLVDDWENLSGTEFDAKYGIHRDSFGFQKSLPEVIRLHFRLGNP